MGIQAGLMEGFRTVAGIASAKAYGACWCQATVFSTVNSLVNCILHRLVCSYIQNTRQLALAEIAIKATSGLAGVLMTRLFCEKTIDWKPALASSVFSDAAAHAICPLVTKPVSLQFISDMMKKTPEKEFPGV